MCGIAGAVWTSRGTPIERDVLERMTDVLAHRGPDGRGFYENSAQMLPGVTGGAQAALGHRRLSIIDRAGGRQPMSNEDGTVWITFNGEIYNYRILRQRLEGSGHVLATASDTEVLVHLYEDEGIDFLRHLNGMFALAIWDANRRQLVIARDRMGKKPLIYRHEPERLLFASELKSLLQVPGVPREINPTALDAYLTYQYVPHPEMILNGFHKLPPAHCAVWRDGELRVERYWNPDFNIEHVLPAEEYRHELRRLLTSAVELRLQADVPLGAFLSGGIDSSIIVGLMKELTGQPVKTFSIGFPVPEYDETSYAREVAERLGTEHHEFKVEPDSVGVLETLAWYYDEPFADSSAIPTYYVSKLTREHVTVALTGDAGDELFAGYLRYRAVKVAEWFDRLPASVRWLLTNRLWERLPDAGRQRSNLRRFHRWRRALANSPARRNLDWVGVFNESARGELYKEDFLTTLPSRDPVEFLAEALGRSSQRDPVTAASLADLVTYLPCDLMVKVDIASMANSLECRAPFLDHRVVELAAAMPAHLKYRRLRGKRILLETFGDLLPQSVQRRGKMGFGVPLDHWFRHELRDYAREILLGPTAQSRDYFRPEAVRQMLDSHQSGVADHSARLWALLFFEMWHRTWLDAPVASSAPVFASTLAQRA
jgi:asparagine synthase (glutamine-hydrolysing)